MMRGACTRSQSKDVRVEEVDEHVIDDEDGSDGEVYAPQRRARKMTIRVTMSATLMRRRWMTAATMVM
jgi:hypothetical protein